MYCIEENHCSDSLSNITMSSISNSVESSFKKITRLILLKDKIPNHVPIYEVHFGTENQSPMRRQA